MNQAESPERLRIVLVTGMSGAGRTTALKTLEDMGYEAVDNLPLSLFSSLVRMERGFQRPVAIGADSRSRDFSVATLLKELDSLKRQPQGPGEAVNVVLLFLDCDDEVLALRYTETRRRHPLAEDRPLMDGIRRERHLLFPLRDRADLVLDTSKLTQADVKRLLEGHFSLPQAAGLTVSLISFSYRRGLPREADLVFDVRFLVNPHYDPDLRPLTGQDEAVGAKVASDPDWPLFFDRLTGLIGLALPRFKREGKSYLTIAVGCTGGRHRSVFAVERLAEWVVGQGQAVTVLHRDVDRPAA